MDAPAMATIPLKYLNIFRDRHGKWRYKVRRVGIGFAYIEGNRYDRDLSAQPETFDSDYRAALAKLGTAPPPEREARPGTLAALIEEYRLTAKYRVLRDSTKIEYDRYLDRMYAEHGHRAVAKLDTAAIERIRDKLLDTPRVADWYVQLFKILCKLAKRRGYIRHNPATDIELIGKRRSYEPWPDEVVTAVLAEAEPMQRLAITMLLYTGQRRSDVARMAWSHFDGELISVAQEKGEAAVTGERLWIACHPVLRAALIAAPREHITILVSERGTALTSNALGLWLSEAIERAGYKGAYVVHGLRATAASKLAEAGCSEKEIASITGHKTLRMVQHYTRGAEQRKLAKAAVKKWSRGARKVSHHPEKEGRKQREKVSQFPSKS